MTTPTAAPAAPATPVAPAAAPDQSGPFAIDAALAAIASESVAAALKNSEAPPASPTPDRDPTTGKFLPKGEAADPGAPDPALEGAAAADPGADDEPITLPEGMAAVPKIEGRELVAAFKVLDKDGELEVPDISLEFEANGKTRREPIDKVVKLAQMGVYNHEREQRMTQELERIQSKEQEYQQIVARARQIEQDRERLLSDPDYLVQMLARYEQENTPEARLTRDREQVEHDRQQIELQQISAQGERFFTGELVPAVETITKALPTVSEEEIGAKLVLLQERFKVHTPQGSYVPPAAYRALKQAFLAEILPWAQQLHEHRDHERRSAADVAKAAAAKSDAEKKAAQTRAQQKTNLIGRSVKPGTRSTHGTGTRETPPAKPIVTVDDAEQAALRDTLAAMAG